MRAGPQDAEVAMFANKTRVLLILPEDVLGQARVLAGRATAALKLSVSLQIVLRALIEEGLKRDGDRALLANVEDQAVAVRRLRSLGRRAGGAEGGRRNLQAGSPRKSRDHEPHRRGKLRDERNVQENQRWAHRGGVARQGC